MDHRAEAWYRRRTTHWREWPLDRLLELDWIRRRDSSRAVRITDTGHEGLRTTFGIDLS